LVALLAVRAELRPVGGGGEWEEDPKLEFNVVTVLYPRDEHWFEVSAREEWEGSWTMVMYESKLRIPLASG
jgi:hypothetical protein